MDSCCFVKGVLNLLARREGDVVIFVAFNLVITDI